MNIKSNHIINVTIYLSITSIFIIIKTANKIIDENPVKSQILIRINNKEFQLHQGKG